MKLFLVLCLAIGTFLAAAVSSASAQTYSFNYSGQLGSNMLSWVATISNVTCNPTCTIGPGDISGTLDVEGTDYALTFSNSTFANPDNVFNINTGVDGHGIELLANGVDYDVFGFSPGSGGIESADVAADGDPLRSAFGTLTYSENAAPAPTAGGGLLSWLGLCVFGVTIWRKKLLIFARLALSNSPVLPRGYP